MLLADVSSLTNETTDPYVRNSLCANIYTYIHKIYLRTYIYSKFNMHGAFDNLACIGIERIQRYNHYSTFTLVCYKDYMFQCTPVQ